MRLFHGSNVEVRQPIIRPNLRALDFGAGFYLSSNEEQAARWAKVVTKRRNTGTAILNIYDLRDELDNLDILHFETANAAWLDFVVMNRKEQLLAKHYDLVIGPIANDATLPVIDDYIDGVYTKEEAVKRLLPQNFTNQYAFLTDKAIALLLFETSVIL